MNSEANSIVASGESVFDPGRILAKSDGECLLEHIKNCLRVYRDLCLALPSIPSILGMEDFFDLLFCVVYLHDWGKAHAEFQKVLKGEKNDWLHGRHEMYSVPFVHMLALPPDRKELICLSILGHHKDFETLVEAYSYSKKDMEEYHRNTPSKVNPLDFTASLQNKMDFKYLRELKKRFREYYSICCPGNGERRFEFVPVDFSSAENPVETYAAPVLHNGSGLPESKSYWRHMLLLGATKLCDHMGSAHRDEIPRLATGNFAFLEKFDGHWFPHQKQCGEVEGNLFLTAPTGSGKTEAALNWIQRQLRSGCQGRIYYVLPYTASINAMHRRLIGDLEQEGAQPGKTRYVGVLHGKISQYLAQYFDEASEDARDLQSRLKNLKELHRQMVHPLKVVTPFQILKYCYGVRGFEMGFTELAGAMLIFDEIHAYDVQTFAQIAVSLGWLTEHLHIRTMIMTATLPSFMLDELQKAIGISAVCETVKADDRLLDEFTRHRVELLEGTVFDQLEMIRKSLRDGRRVIVVCNTVANAQSAFSKIETDAGPQELSILLHSRFIARDRFDKERRLSDEEVRLLVGTQAIEVSLDIDFDVMFTEPAPLDALIQRFGRINRRREKGICPVYVCSEGDKYDGLIYPAEVVKRTLSVLSRVSMIKESDLQEMLDEVYPDWPDRAKYEDTREGFLVSLNRLKPFMRHKEEEDAFYEKFDSVAVLPVAFQRLYEEHMARFEFFEAQGLFISVHRGMFHKLLRRDLLERSAAVVEMGGKLKQFPYYVLKCRYDPRVGLIEDEEVSEPAGTLSF